MDYDEFDAEYQRVVSAAEGDLSTADLRAEIARLRELAEGIEDQAGRQSAQYDIAMLDDLLAHEGSLPPSAAMTEAFAAYSAATADDGSPSERVVRAQQGIEALTRIAATADADDRESILGMNESLVMLISALQPDLR